MEAKRRYTVMVFPQTFDGKKLSVNIVLIPRNQNPFEAYNTGLAAPNNSAVSFASFQPVFELAVVKGLDEWPVSSATVPERLPVKIPINVNPAANKESLLKAIAASMADKLTPDTPADRADAILPEERSVSKYLPESYRSSFNFTSPRHRNAKTDDSYHCAATKKTEKDPLWKNDERLTWGHLYAHILRQPMLARACGMIYSAELDVEANADLFRKGCYLYADIVNDDYAAIQTELLNDAEGPFIKRYAARMPKLTINEKRPVFAPVLFPVLYAKPGDPVQEPKGRWDRIFQELNEYNDGFASIVHASQSVSNNILSERQDGAAPSKDTGIKLGWDDEQILIWYIRQLTSNPEEPGKRLDAPLGVYGYRLDVRDKEIGGAWSSLNLVRSKEAYKIGEATLGNAVADEIELPYQVFPTQLDNNRNAPYWLPMYFTHWTGKSLVLKDIDALRIDQNDLAQVSKDDDTPRSVDAENKFEEVKPAVDLRYGKAYEFRVRLMDISGGGPSAAEDPVNAAPAPHASHQFKRFVAPSLCRIEKPAGLKQAKTEFFNETITSGISKLDANPVLQIGRPLLNYPAVVFTDKYQLAGLDPVQLLMDSVLTQGDSKTPAIADPDVTAVEITVEVETLRLDNLLSESGTENYITLYKTQRAFAADFNSELTLPVVFHDIHSLNLGNADDPFNRADLTRVAIDGMIDIPIPTARRVRLTVRAVCDGDGTYFGFINDNRDLDSRYGKSTSFWFYKESQVEDELLFPKPGIANIKGIFLQPDPVFVNDGKLYSTYFVRERVDQLPDIVQRLAQQLGLVSNNLTLMAKKGQRVVFGCSNRIRHHLSPDQSSITFSSKGDLMYHWLTCVVYQVNRDWSWNALQDTSFVVSRTKRFVRDAEIEREELPVLGSIEMKRYASFESLIPDDFDVVDRNSTTLIFIDAVEPKSSLKQPTGELRFPDEIEVSYKLTPLFRPGHGSETSFSPEKLTLPSTINPAQVPKIASVGIAFSPYITNTTYSATEPRQKYLWVELTEAIKDPRDALFCRVLAYAPDQMLGNNRSGVNDIPEEPPLPIDPEFIRTVVPGQTDDLAGLSAMQLMEKASGEDDLHFLLPLPPGLHPESAELFGFFTYEFRIGHGHWSLAEDEKENLWSTAQGRFGRPLRVTGVQHPAPTLLCIANRDKDKLIVNAPYAKAVWKGKNVTPEVPRTHLHCALYAQVKQADGLGYRNILLDEKFMNLDAPTKAERPFVAGELTRFAGNEIGRWSAQDKDIQAKAGVALNQLVMFGELKSLVLDRLTTARIQGVLRDRAAGKRVELDRSSSVKLLQAISAQENSQVREYASGRGFTPESLLAGAALAIQKDKIKTGSAEWDNKEIAALLTGLGLPEDSPISVLTVEVFGNITNVYEHMGMSLAEIKKLTGDNVEVYNNIEARYFESQRALSANVGNYRILRTSPLTEVPFICCPTCG